MITAIGQQTSASMICLILVKLGPAHSRRAQRKTISLQNDKSPLFGELCWPNLLSYLAAFNKDLWFTSLHVSHWLFYSETRACSIIARAAWSVPTCLLLQNLAVLVRVC